MNNKDNITSLLSYVPRKSGMNYAYLVKKGMHCVQCQGKSCRWWICTIDKNHETMRSSFKVTGGDVRFLQMAEHSAEVTNCYQTIKRIFWNTKNGKWALWIPPQFCLLLHDKEKVNVNMGSDSHIVRKVINKWNILCNCPSWDNSRDVFMVNWKWKVNPQSNYFVLLKYVIYTSGILLENWKCCL